MMETCTPLCKHWDECFEMGILDYKKIIINFNDFVKLHWGDRCKDLKLSDFEDIRLSDKEVI